MSMTFLSSLGLLLPSAAVMASSVSFSEEADTALIREFSTDLQYTEDRALVTTLRVYLNADYVALVEEAGHVVVTEETSTPYVEYAIARSNMEQEVKSITEHPTYLELFASEEETLKEGISNADFLTKRLNNFYDWSTTLETKTTLTPESDDEDEDNDGLAGPTISQSSMSAQMQAQIRLLEDVRNKAEKRLTMFDKLIIGEGKTVIETYTLPEVIEKFADMKDTDGNAVFTVENVMREIADELRDF